MDEQVKTNDVESNNFKKLVGMVIISTVALIFSLISLFTTMKVKSMMENNEEAEKNVVNAEDISYCIYMGLTDKDAGYQTLNEDVAIEIVKTVCIQVGVAYTIFPVQGGYKDNKGVLHTENTLVLEMDHITEKNLYEVLNNLCKRLNTNGAMVSKENKEIFYYSKN